MPDMLARRSNCTFRACIASPNEMDRRILHLSANFDAGHSPLEPPARRRTSRAICPQSAHLHSKRSDARGVPNANGVLPTARKKPSHLGQRPASGLALSLTISVCMVQGFLSCPVVDDDRFHRDALRSVAANAMTVPLRRGESLAQMVAFRSGVLRALAHTQKITFITRS
jgi:hypothetical protein